MGWSIGYDSKWRRDIGYGVPDICDHPDCNEVIDHGGQRVLITSRERAEQYGHLVDVPIYVRHIEGEGE